jgi:hypothetical protein
MSRHSRANSKYIFRSFSSVTSSATRSHSAAFPLQVSIRSLMILLPLTKRAAVGIVPPGAKRLVMGWRQKFLNAHPSALPALIVKRRQRRRNPIHFMQFSPQQIQVTDLKGLSDLHGLEELFRCVGAPALSIQCCDPRVLCGNSLLPRRNEHLGPKNHFF